MSTKKKAPSTSAKLGRSSKGGTSTKARTSPKPPSKLKQGSGLKGHTTPVAKASSSPKPSGMEKAIRRNIKSISATIGSMAPPGSPERVAAGVAAVAGGALIAGATLGAGPAALAGAAGYLAYKGLSGPETKKGKAGSAIRKRANTRKPKS